MPERFTNLLQALNGLTAANRGTLLGVVERARTAKGPIQTRLWSSLSWGDLVGAAGSVVWNGGLPALQSWWREDVNYLRVHPEEGVLELLRDPEFPKIISDNRELIRVVVEKSIASGIPIYDRQIDVIRENADVFTNNLTALIQHMHSMAVRDGGIESLGPLQERVFSELEAAEAEGRDTDLFNICTELMHSAMGLMNANPQIVKDSFNIGVLTPEDEMHKVKYQEPALRMLQWAKGEGQEQNFATYCENYREFRSVRAGSLLDTYTEHYAHSRSLAGIEIAGIEDRRFDLEGFHFDKFDFRFSTFRHVNLKNTRLVNCNFSYVEFEEGIDLQRASIDVATFKTMLPSLRQAQAQGRPVSLRGCHLTGAAEGLDLRGINHTGLDLSGARVLQIRRDGRIPSIKLNRNEVAERRKIHRFVEGLNPLLVEKISSLSDEQIEFAGLMTSVEERIYAEIERMENPAERKILISILQDNPAAKEEFQKEFLNPVLREVNFREITPPPATGWAEWAGSWLGWGASFVAPQAAVNLVGLGKRVEPQMPLNKITNFLSVIRNKRKYRFRQMVEEHEEEIEMVDGVAGKQEDTLSGHRERQVSLENFLMLGGNPVVNRFMHYDGTQKPTMFGRVFRRVVEGILPTFLKPLVYENTKLGSLCQSRGMIQGLRMGVAIIWNGRAIFEGYKNITATMNDLNLWFDWITPEKQQRAWADVFKTLVGNKTLRKSFVMYDKDGNPQRDEQGRVMINDLTVDFLCSTVDIFNDPRQVKTLLRYGYDVLELLEKSNALDELNKLVYTTDIHHRKQILLQISESLSPAEMLRLEEGLQQILPVIRELARTNRVFRRFTGKDMETAQAEEEAARTSPYQFPHHATKKTMDRVFEEMGKAAEDQQVDLSRAVFRGKKADFSYGAFTGTDEEPVEVKNIEVRKFNATSTKFTDVGFRNSKLTGDNRRDKPNFLFLGANFDHAQFRRTDFRNMEMPDVYFDGAVFEGGKFERVTMPKAEFTGARLSEVTWRSCNIARADLTDMVFSRGRIEEANLENAQCERATIEESTLVRAYFKEANLQEASLWRSTIIEGNFANANMRGANLSGAILNNCNLRGADLIGVNLEDIKIEGSIDLEGAKLTRNQLNSIRNAARRYDARVLHEPTQADLEASRAEERRRSTSRNKAREGRSKKHTDRLTRDAQAQRQVPHATR